MADQDLRSFRSTCADDVLGESACIKRTLDITRRVAASGSTVLLTGETGTGKELFARAVHRGSTHAAGPFITVNCAAIPDHLIESELFGHVKGAFTGASAQRVGRFAAAHDGTLFLDEIGELPLAAQAKLLRALETRSVCPVGADDEVPVNVRVVAATHRDLEDMVAQGTFRADLFFRLSVVPIELPSLRARGEDILLLAEAAIRRVAKRGGRLLDLDASARVALKSYAWPGNVRELNHVLERALVLADGSALTAADLRLGSKSATLSVVPPSAIPVVVTESIPVLSAASVDDDTLDLRTALDSLERRLIRQALERAHGNRTEAAALLGLNRTTLVEKLRRYA